MLLRRSHAAAAAACGPSRGSAAAEALPFRRHLRWGKRASASAARGGERAQAGLDSGDGSYRRCERRRRSGAAGAGVDTGAIGDLGTGRAGPLPVLSTCMGLETCSAVFTGGLAHIVYSV